MLAPYLDGYGHATEGTGLSYFLPAVLNRSVTRLDGEGFQVHFHAIGDRAVREALDAARLRGPRASRNQRGVAARPPAQCTGLVGKRGFPTGLTRNSRCEAAVDQGGAGAS
jgi:hypothetical protein